MGKPQTKANQQNLFTIFWEAFLLGINPVELNWKNKWLILVFVCLFYSFFFFLIFMNCDPKRSERLFFPDVILSLSCLRHPVFFPSESWEPIPFLYQWWYFLRLLTCVSSSIFLHSIQRVPKKQQKRKQRIADEILDHWNYSTHGICHSLQNTICLTQHPVPKQWKSQKISCSQLSSIHWYCHLLIILLRILYYSCCKIVSLANLSGESVLFTLLQF